MTIETQYNYEKIWSQASEPELLKIIEQEVGDADPEGTLEYVKEVVKKGKVITVGTCKFRAKEEGGK